MLKDWEVCEEYSSSTLAYIITILYIGYLVFDLVD